MKARLSVIIPTYNEEASISRALACADFADEVMVIDSFSTDQTPEIVKKSNCTFLQREFDNFSNQKNFAISKAKNDWILILDADEYIPYNLQKELLRILSKPEKTAYKIPFKNFFINRFIHHGTNGNKKKLRLFNRNSCKYQGLVHEQLLCHGEPGILKNRILHYTFKSLFHFFEKKNHYSDLQAEQLFQKGKKAKTRHFVLKPFFRFFNEYLLKMGYLDGIAGLTSASMNGYGVLSRYVKLKKKRNELSHPLLLEYESFVSQLMNEARVQGLNEKKSKPIPLIYFYSQPLAVFLKYYFIKKQFKSGLEGYIISYLQAFKKYNVLLYHWLSKRGLE